MHYFSGTSSSDNLVKPVCLVKPLDLQASLPSINHTTNGKNNSSPVHAQSASTPQSFFPAVDKSNFRNEVSYEASNQSNLSSPQAQTLGTKSPVCNISNKTRNDENRNSFGLKTSFKREHTDNSPKILGELEHQNKAIRVSPENTAPISSPSLIGTQVINVHDGKTNASQQVLQEERSKSCQSEGSFRCTITPTNNVNNNCINNNMCNSSGNLVVNTSINNNVSDPKSSKEVNFTGVKSEAGMSCYGYKNEENAGLIRPGGITEVSGDTRYDIPPSYTTLDLDRQSATVATEASHVPPATTTSIAISEPLILQTSIPAPMPNYNSLKTSAAEFTTPIPPPAITVSSNQESFYGNKICDVKPSEAQCTPTCIPPSPQSLYQT